MSSRWEHTDWFWEPWEKPLLIEDRQLLFDAWMYWIRVGGFSRQPVINTMKLLPLEAVSLNGRVVYMEYETGLKIWWSLRDWLLIRTIDEDRRLHLKAMREAKNNRAGG